MRIKAKFLKYWKISIIIIKIGNRFELLFFKFAI